MVVHSRVSAGRLAAAGAAALPLGIPGETGRRFQLPRVTSVAWGFWAMGEDALLRGVGLEQEFFFSWFACCHLGTRSRGRSHSVSRAVTPV